MNIGIIGKGFVGGAIYKAFQKDHQMFVYDKFKHIGDFNSVVENSEFIFVCVPTPTNHGEQDLSMVNEVFGHLHDFCYRGPVVLKSTVLPGTCDKLSAKFPSLAIYHNPEFLREATAYEDFVNQKFSEFSGSKRDIVSSFIIEEAFKTSLPNCEVRFHTDYKVTELGKYIHNCFLATKVAFMNQIYDYCNLLGVSYQQALSVAIGQDVIGKSHCLVPGPDGKRGFGGSCFTKDTAALLCDHEEVLSILNEAVRYNNRIRK